MKYRVFSPNFPPKYLSKRAPRPYRREDASDVTYRFGKGCGEQKLLILLLSLILM